MVTIIKPGNAGKEECQVCGCIFRFEYDDIDSHGCQREPESYITCPCCGNSVKVHIIPKRKDAIR
jgi:hypothetical protein